MGFFFCMGEFPTLSNCTTNQTLQERKAFGSFAVNLFALPSHRRIVHFLFFSLFRANRLWHRSCFSFQPQTKGFINCSHCPEPQNHPEENSHTQLSAVWDHFLGGSLLELLQPELRWGMHTEAQSHGELSTEGPHGELCSTGNPKSLQCGTFGQHLSDHQTFRGW